MCTSLNYVHNAHCNFLKIQTVSMQETTIWMVQSSYFSVQRAVSFWDIHNTMRKTPARSFQSTFFPTTNTISMSNSYMSKMHEKE